MSRGPDDIIAEYVAAQHGKTKTPQVIAEEIEEALDAEDYMAVHRDCTLMFSPTSHLEIELSKRKDRSVTMDVQEVIAHWHAKHVEKMTGG